MPYKIVVEPCEYDQYVAVISKSKILCAPEDFSLLKQGSIPVRNFVWEHSIEQGFEWHWIMDDNIQAFWRLNKNLRIRVADGTIFRCAEDFVNRYENVGQAGFQYYMFCKDTAKWPPFTMNTRVYSCILNNNKVKHRWRGRYNEDTDLSIRILKDGWVTLYFNAFLAQKATTGTVKGGNMELLYGGNDQISGKGKEWIEKRRLMAQSLVDQHPNICTISWKWNRPQHQVNYSGFKRNKLIRKPGWNYSGIDNYGMKLVEIKKPELEPKKEEKPFDQDYWKKQGIGTDKPAWDISNLKPV